MTLNGTQTPSENTTTAADVLGADPALSAAPEKSETQKPDERVSPKLQMLARREKTALERERAAKAKEAEIQARLKEFEAREARVKEFESLRETNPLKALELLGLTYQDLTKAQLADGELPPDVHVRKLDEKLNSLVKTQEEAMRRGEEEAKRRSEEQERKAVESFKGEITTYLKENAERYELIAFEGAEDLVYDVIEEHYTRTFNQETGVGEVLTKAQAADKVEEHLEKKYQKAPDLKKVSAFLSQRTEKAPERSPFASAAKPPLQNRQTPKTLNNQLSATPTPKRAAPVTDDERIAKAIAYARGLRP